MNKERVLYIAQLIDDHAAAEMGLYGVVGFNMRDFVSIPVSARDVDANITYDKVDSCGTVACIAGWCCLVALGEAKVKPAIAADVAHAEGQNGSDWTTFRETWETAFYKLRKEGFDVDGEIYRTFDSAGAAYLGLKMEDARELFGLFGHILNNRGLSTITAAEAVACLRNLAATGEVDWAKAFNTAAENAAANSGAAA